MGNFAGNVVKDVGLGDTVGSMSPEPGHDAAAITKQVTVESGEGTALEVELRGTVMGNQGIRVLEECDEYKPVVDPKTWLDNFWTFLFGSSLPEIGDEISTEDSQETKVVDGSSDTGEPKEHANSRHEDLALVMGREHRSAGVKVWAQDRISGNATSVDKQKRTMGSLGITLLSRCIPENVGRPATELRKESTARMAKATKYNARDTRQSPRQQRGANRRQPPRAPSSLPR